jgi:hypothetical protein
MTNAPWLTRAAAIGLMLTITGCWRLTIVNGQAPAPAPAIDDQWRSATVLDAVAIDTPTRLELACKETGWAKIHSSQSFLNGVVDVFLAGAVYESTHADVYCADGAVKPQNVKPPPAEKGQRDL